MYVGFATQQELSSILKKDCVTYNDLNKFRIDAKQVLMRLLEKMFDKNLLYISIVKYASVLDPGVLVSQPLDVCKSLFQRLLITLLHLTFVCSSQADLALSEFSSFLSKN